MEFRRVLFRSPADGVLHRPGLAGDLDVVDGVEQIHQATPDHLVVIDDEDADRGVGHDPSSRLLPTSRRPGPRSATSGPSALFGTRAAGDRTNGVWGTRVSVRCATGGGRV